MFDLALYNELKEINKIDSIKVKWGYNEIPDGTDDPYIVQYTLDRNTDRELLCDDFDDGGQAFIQWNVYSTKGWVSDRIAYELERILDSYVTDGQTLTYSDTSYTISMREHNSSPSAQVIENELATSVLTNTFFYRKE